MLPRVRIWKMAVAFWRRVSGPMPWTRSAAPVKQSLLGWSKWRCRKAQLGFERDVPVTTYCQWRLAALAADGPPALADYRRLN